MDRVELAERQYRDLVHPDLLAQPKALWPHGLPSHKVTAWIEDYVIPAAEELWPRPQFRELAAWPQRHLAPGSATPERQDVLAMADALVAAAAALIKLAARPAVAARIQSVCPPQSTVVREEVRISSDRQLPEVLGREAQLMSDLPILQRQVASIAGRPWTDLVCSADYFGPRGDLEGKPPEWATALPSVEASLPTADVRPAKIRRSTRRKSSIEPVQGELHPYFNRRLVPLGDLVTRCMMTRVRVARESIDGFRACVRRAADAAGGRGGVDAATEQAAWDRLRDRHDALQKSCMGADTLALREGATALTQVCLTFRPGAEAEWLGLPVPLVAQGDAWLRCQLVQRRDLQTLERLAAALGEMRKLYRDHPPGEAAFDQAVATGGLVVCEEPPALYWGGRLVPVDWKTHRSDWEFWLKLATKGRHGGAVGRGDLYGDGVVADSTLYNRRRRADACIRELAPDLANLIDNGLQSASYRLNLEPRNVHVFPRRYRAAQ